MKEWAKNRLREKSTWTSIIGLIAAAAGYSFGDEQTAALAAAIAALVAAFVTKESGDPGTRHIPDLSADDLVSLRELHAERKASHQAAPRQPFDYHRGR